MPYFAVKAKMRLVLVVLFVLLLALLAFLSSAADVRMPKILLAATVGAGLSIVGGCFQSIFKNPMADPYIMGISSATTLGAAIGLVLGINIAIPTSACSVLATVVVYIISRFEKRLTSASLVLSGVAVGFLFSAITSVLTVLNRDITEPIALWMMGNIISADWMQTYVTMAVTIVSGLAILFFARRLNIMSIDADTAKSLGIETESVKIIVLVLCAVIVAACVSVSGTIGFVGLIIPNIVRKMTGPDNRIILPISMISGAIFLVLANAATGLLPVLPIGVITAVIGAPFMIYVLLTTKTA